jgi:hypothetical protein
MMIYINYEDHVYVKSILHNDACLLCHTETSATYQEIRVLTCVHNLQQENKEKKNNPERVGNRYLDIVW